MLIFSEISEKNAVRRFIRNYIFFFTIYEHDLKIIHSAMYCTMKQYYPFIVIKSDLIVSGKDLTGDISIVFLILNQLY